MPLRGGKITIDATRTALPLVSAITTDRLSSKPAKWIIIQGLATNTGNWYFGDANVNPKNYFFVGVALDSLMLPRMGSGESQHDLSQLYITTDNIGDGVTFFYE